MIGKVVTDNVLGNGIISHNTVGGEAPSAEDPVISEFTITVASTSAGGKDNFRGYSKGQFVGFGTTSTDSFELADGTTSHLTNTSYVSSLGGAFFELDSGFSTDRIDMRVHILGATAPPTFNDSNWFKSLKITNNTDSASFTLQRSGFSSPSTTTDNTNCISTIQHSNPYPPAWGEGFFDTGDSITVQLRRD